MEEEGIPDVIETLQASKMVYNFEQLKELLPSED